MPSFKERFRSSRKDKKNKETSNINSADDSNVASGLGTTISTTSAFVTADNHPSSSSHYSVEYCK